MMDHASAAEREPDQTAQVTYKRSILLFATSATAVEMNDRKALPDRVPDVRLFDRSAAGTHQL